jgi:outer membrane murein-binding lipoprotein Lpp
MTNDKSSGVNGTMLLGGVNTLALIALLTYTVRNISDLNAYIEELSHELKTLKTSHNDSTKRVHSAISKLSYQMNGRNSQSLRPEPKVEEIKEEEINSRVDEVSAAIDELLRS